MAQNIESSLKSLSEIGGFIAAAIVDADSGMTLGTIGGNAKFDIEVGAAANREVYSAKLRAAEALELTDAIEDILITLSSQYHVIRPGKGGVFIYIAVDRAKANLALVRRAATQVEQNLRV